MPRVRFNSINAFYSVIRTFRK
uniref:Uncharacterized protein n=1 Tax=Alfalfa mosaic virus TaxID=12321 RepID=Q8V5Y0_AMV|nr:unknown [Alfalfa mosaic virus]